MPGWLPRRLMGWQKCWLRSWLVGRFPSRLTCGHAGFLCWLFRWSICWATLWLGRREHGGLLTGMSGRLLGVGWSSSGLHRRVGGREVGRLKG